MKNVADMTDDELAQEYKQLCMRFFRLSEDEKKRYAAVSAEILRRGP